jgi:hypothetical protein
VPSSAAAAAGLVRQLLAPCNKHLQQ